VNGFVGTGQLVRLALRRDRIMLPGWILAFAAVAASAASATVGLYPTVESRVQVAMTMNNTPSLVALYGRVYDPTSLGAVSMIKLGGVVAALVSVFAVITVVRHTRAEEESGRLELVGATVVGRYAALTAALLVSAGANLVLGLLTALGLAAAGLPVAGSFAFGLAWAGVGIAFAAVAAVTAQLAASARTATAMASAFLAFVYVLRAIGDTAEADGPTWLSWLSPIGWGQQFRPYAGDRWWVLLITLGFAAVLSAGAYALVSRRDLDAGLLPDRLGRATATPSLRSPLALALRLQRTSLLGWTVAFALAGLVLGNITSNIDGLLDSPQAREMITELGGRQSLTDAFLAAEMGIVGFIASAYGIQAAMRLRIEETSLRLEPLLATPVSRTRWVHSHLVIALGGVTLLLAAAGITAGLSRAAQSGDAGQIGRVLGGALAQAPATWVLTGVVVLFFGAAPRLAVAGWLALVACLLLGQLGSLFGLSQWAMDLSPFIHVPRLPGGEFSATPLIWLAVVAAALLGTGLAAFRRRDIG
jgi:ABC-2 type transport system permease protein